MATATTPGSASTVPSGCSSTGARSTTSSTSSVSRTSPTTSGRAWATSCTWSTRAVGRRPDRPGGHAVPVTNGRVWKMVLDPTDPTEVTSFSIAVEGDDNPVKTLNEIHQPDNIETTQTGLLVTEDPGSSQQFVAADQGLPNATTARLWYVPFSGSPEVVVKIDQSTDGDAGCRRRRASRRQLGRVGDHRHRRRLGGVRRGRVPDQRPGAHALDRAGAGPGHLHRRRDRGSRLHVQARRRAAAADPHPRDLAARKVEGRPSGRPLRSRPRRSIRVREHGLTA